MAVFQDLRVAVAEHHRDGDPAAFEGFTHPVPHAAALEAIRRERAGLLRDPQARTKTAQCHAGTIGAA